MGVFTRDIQLAFRAHRELEVGGVVIGDVPSFRADQMPCGGVKQSGVGREGLRAAMEDYTYERALVLSGVDLWMSARRLPSPRGTRCPVCPRRREPGRGDSRNDRGQPVPVDRVDEHTEDRLHRLDTQHGEH